MSYSRVILWYFKHIVWSVKRPFVSKSINLPISSLKRSWNYICITCFMAYSKRNTKTSNNLLAAFPYYLSNNNASREVYKNTVSINFHLGSYISLGVEEFNSIPAHSHRMKAAPSSVIDDNQLKETLSIVLALRWKRLIGHCFFRLKHEGRGLLAWNSHLSSVCLHDL